MASRWLLLLLCLGSLLQAGAVNAASQTFFVIGDTGDCETAGAALVGQALRRQADWPQATLIETGDLAYPVASRERLLSCHEPHFSGFARRLAVPGNHDWADNGGAGFFATFPGDMPRKEALGGAWHLLMLNSNLKEEANAQQLAWLDQTLAASRGECLIAAWHHPRWSSGKHGDNPYLQGFWQRLLGQATFTLHGHDHHFEALPALDAGGEAASDGLPSFIVGHGGARLYESGWGPARSKRAHYGDWGFLRLELDDTSYRWQAFTTEGKIVDRGTGRCTPAGASRAP